MNITIRDPESSNNSLGNSSGNYKFSFNPSNQSSTKAESSTPASGDKFQVSAETIKASIEKEKDFNISSSDNRIEQTSIKLYNNQLNTIKALSTSGKLIEILEKVGSNDKNNSFGYSLNQILDKAKITRNGKILNSEELLEALKNDKDGKVKESINNAISDIQAGGSFKEKLTWANDKHDGESQFAATTVTGAAALKASSMAWSNKGVVSEGVKALTQTAAKTWGKEIAVKGVGKFLLGAGTRQLGGTLLRTAFGMNPLGLGLMVGSSLALWALNNTDQGKAIKESVSSTVANTWESIPGLNQVDDFVGNIGDNIGYQLSKFG
jgi:hypothetical protein